MELVVKKNQLSLPKFAQLRGEWRAIHEPGFTGFAEFNELQYSRNMVAREPSRMLVQ